MFVLIASQAIIPFSRIGEALVQLQMFLDCHPFAHLHHDTPVVVGGDLNDVYGGLGTLLAPAGFRGIDRRKIA